MFHDPGRYRDDPDRDRRDEPETGRRFDAREARYDRRAFDRGEDYQGGGFRDPGDGYDPPGEDRRGREPRSFGGREPFVPAWAEPPARDPRAFDRDRDRDGDGDADRMRHGRDRDDRHERDERDLGRDDGRERGDREGWDFGRTDRRYSLEDTRRRLPREETERLIASDKVEGAPVYDLHGRRVGEVANFMVDKRSGRVEYAVVRVRGGLVRGEAWRPIEWRDLRYDEELDGYQIDLDRQALRHDRSFEAGR